MSNDHHRRPGDAGPLPGLPHIPTPVYAVLTAVAAVVAAAIGVAYAGTSTPAPPDVAVAGLLTRVLPEPGLLSWLILSAGDPLPALALTLLLAWACARLGNRPLTVVALLGPLVTGVVTTAAKPLAGRTINDSLCYPSGHTAALTTFGLVIGLLVAVRRRWHATAAASAALGGAVPAGLLEAVPLVRGDIHYATDTVGGLCAALAVTLPLVAAVSHRRGSRHVPGGPGPDGPADADPGSSRGPGDGRRLCAESAYPAPLLAIAAYGLPGAERPLPATPLDRTAWERVLAGAERHRVTGALFAAVTDGALPTTDEQRRQISGLHRSIQLRVMALEHALVGVVELLESHDIPTRVLKGSALARLDYAEPALRSFIDLDVLVRPDDVDRAGVVLADAGFERTLAEPRPGFDRRFDKGMTLISPGTGFELDLHRIFVLGPWGLRIDLDELWAGHEDFALGARSVRGLCRSHRFMHACYHAALGDWPLRLGSLRDVAEILRGLGPDDDTPRELAEAWRVEAVVAAAVADSHRLLGLRGGGETLRWASAYRPSRKEISWLALHTRPDKTFAAQALATVPELPRWRDRAAYLHALALPRTEYTADRHGSALGRFRYAIAEARRGMSRSPAVTPGSSGPVPVADRRSG